MWHTGSHLACGLRYVPLTVLSLKEETEIRSRPISTLAASIQHAAIAHLDNRRSKEVDMATTLTAGTPAPDLTLPLLDGENISLTDLRGKRLLLFFWGSW
jgi:hypothetical protein